MNTRLLKTLITTFIFATIFFAFVGSNQAQEISIPAINVNTTIGYAPIARGTWDVSHLRMNVARLEGLPWFDSNSNVVIAGHSEDTAGNPDIFYQLDQLNIGDSIYINVDGQSLHYVVTEKRNVSQRDLSILYPTNDHRLTLFTCDTGSYTEGAYLRRDVVIARRVG